VRETLSRTRLEALNNAALKKEDAVYKAIKTYSDNGDTADSHGDGNSTRRVGSRTNGLRRSSFALLPATGSINGLEGSTGEKLAPSAK